MKELVLQTYMQHKMAKEAVDMGIAKDPIVAARALRAKERVLLSYRLTALDELPIPNLDEAVKEYYAANIDDYKSGDTVDTNNVFLQLLTHSNAAAKKIMERVQAELASGKDFDAVIRENKDAAMVIRKGKEGHFKRDQLQKPIEDVVFAMKEPGALSGVIETDLGFYLFQLVKYNPVEVKSFDDVKEQIEQKLTTEFRVARRQDKFDELKSTSTLKFDDEALAAYVEKRTKEVDEVLEKLKALSKEEK
jgi:hypothetical protein